MFGIRSYRLGRWKALLLPPPYGTGGWQLFNIDADPGETTDLAASNPVRLRELIMLWEAYASENGVVEPDRPMAYAKPLSK